MRSPIKVTFEIGGKKLRPNTCTVEQHVNGHSSFYVVVDSNAFGNHDGVVDTDEIYDMLAHEVSIKIDNTSNSDDQLDFIGVVADISVGKDNTGFDTVSLMGKGKTYFIDDRPDVKTYHDTTLSAILKDALADFDGKMTVDLMEDPEIDYCTQYCETAFDFATRLCQQYGQWLYYDGQDLQVGAYKDQKEWKLHMGTHTAGYSLDLAMLPLNLGYTHYDYVDNMRYTVYGADGAKIPIGKYGEGAADASLGVYTRKPLSIFTPRAKTKDDISQFVRSRVKSTAAQLFVVSGDSGNPGMKLGTTVTVFDQKKANLGTYNITRVSHNWQGQGRYTNHFEARPTELKSPPPTRLRVPKAPPQVAVIVDNADPDNLGRVQINFPWQPNEAKSPWIRCVYPYAGAGHHYFCPEIKDQVMVGFEHDNPDRPYVMGSVYQGKKPPKYAVDDNSYKAIHTKSGHRIVFEDGDDANISIHSSDDKNSIILSLAGDGEINITTEGILNLKGKTLNLEGEELNIKMEKAINIEAGQDLSQKGANVSITADQAASMSGTEAKVEGQSEAALSGAQVKVEGQATTTIKGAMVQIN